MASKDKHKKVHRIKTGSFERRLSLTRSGLLAGGRIVAQAPGLWLGSKQGRANRRQRMLSEEAQYLVKELGDLKGGAVKIGQMMALYGEHFLPPEVTEALHTLEDRTVALHWPSIEKVLQAELGATKLQELDIEHEPIGAASLGQVHRATVKKTGQQLCMKIQYPGVADTVDSDVDSVAGMLKMANLITATEEFSTWLEEVRTMLHREVDYSVELETTQRFRKLLKHDKRFVVPKMFPQFSTPHVLTMSYESGHALTSREVQELSQQRRNSLGALALELFLREVFEWGEIQTDPNFGNYRIRIANSKRSVDKIVLLDFGAVQRYERSFLQPLRDMISGAYENDLAKVQAAAIALDFIKADYPDDVRQSFTEVCAGIIEPLVFDPKTVPENALNEKGEYKWKDSDLPTRIAKRAAKSSFSRYFRIPPKEFLF
ncbi:MAG: ABC1 kinase family protein, partial [Pseudomonadales bacterium]